MTYPRLAKLVVFGLPLFTLPACNHHTGMALPRADAGPDAGWGADVSRGVDRAPDSPVPDASFVDLGRGEADAGPDVGGAVDSGKVEDTATDGPTPDVPIEDVGTGGVEVERPPVDASALDGPSPAMLTVDPSSASWSAYFVGEQQRTDPPTVFSVQNRGATTTGTLQMAVTGPNTTDYSLVSDTCSGVQLPAQGSCAVGLVYSPPSWSIGSPAAALVATDTASGGSVTVPLFGVTYQDECLLALDRWVDLGSVLPGATGGEVRIAVENGCDWADLGPVYANLSGSGVGDVRISTNTCITLAASGICVIGLQLVPPSDAVPGTVAATLTVHASNGGMQQVAIRGTILANSNPGIDAAIDGAPGAVDADQDAGAFLFPELPGHTFQIAAGNTLPDASAGPGVACKSPSQNIAYSLTFSADGTKVHVVRMDSVQEATLDGTLVGHTDTTLRYTINTGLGGALMVWKESGTLVAQFELYGSGVPVVQCIDSPMTKV